MKNHSPSEAAAEVDKKIAALRQQLAADVAAWPEATKALLADLSFAQDEEMEEDAMLELIVQDVLRGVDVPRKHPQIYRRLLGNSQLRQTFLEMLTALMPDRDEEIPPMPKPDLSFLSTAVSTQAIVHNLKSGWQATWKLLGDHLTNCFPPSQTLAYRSAYDDLLEEQNIILLEDEFSVDGLQLNVLLEANLEAEQPDTPTLSLSVAAVSGQQLPSLQAGLLWGRYEATAVLDRYGMARFPRLAIASVLDETRQVIQADLQLILESISP